jgi:hypothetical protein
MNQVAPRQQVSIETITAMLLDQVHRVVQVYAPAANGSYVDKHLFFTLNPGRADRSVGSFCVALSGPKAGHWNDYATGGHGDLLDLIALAHGCSLADALHEARSFLGLEASSPEQIRQRETAAQMAKARQQQVMDEAKREAAKKARQALAIWLSGREHIRGTPVEAYLREARGIDLAPLGRQPRALRYVPDCFYGHTDPETGEIIEMKLPAMVALVTNGRGESVAIHRTYLAIGPDGRWGKANLPKAKKVLGQFAGAAIHLWSGTGPRGGKGGSLRDCPPGSRVYIAEGIEDALSAVVLLPDARVLAAISLGNLGAVVLPKNVSEVVLIADRDPGQQAQDLLKRAIDQHAAAGRTVRLWQNQSGGKDLNDALRLQRGVAA